MSIVSSVHHYTNASHLSPPLAPSNVHSISEIKISAAVTNTGSEDLKVLKYGTILDAELPTRSFKISKNGEAATFTGIKMQVDLTQAGDSAFVVIPAGQTVTVEHEGKCVLSLHWRR